MRRTAPANRRRGSRGKGIQPGSPKYDGEGKQGIGLGADRRPCDTNGAESGRKQQCGPYADQAGGYVYDVKLIVQMMRQQQLEDDHGAQRNQGNPQGKDTQHRHRVLEGRAQHQVYK